MSTEEQRWEWVSNLDDQMLDGGAQISEHACELIRNADISFASGAYVACIVMSAATIETWLRVEGCDSKKWRFQELIDSSEFDITMKKEMHNLRKARNRWVHVDTAQDDLELLDQHDKGHPQLEAECREAVVTMRKVVFSNPWV